MGHVKVLSPGRWYGKGYCNICGDHGPSLVPRQVRYWDPDDGWVVGVLCTFCTEDADSRGPRPDDYAVGIRQRNPEHIIKRRHKK